MRVFRHRHTLGFTALLALAMQVALVFANTHVHTASLQRGDGIAARAITFGLCRADAGRPCPPPARHDDTKCSICWQIGLAGAAVLSLPPPLPMRQPQIEAPPPPRTVALAQGGESVHFQARAPPLRVYA